jgi:hypothetical protein
MSNEKFVYVTYIATTPRMAWKALLEGELTRQYWKQENVSDWKPGSKWELVDVDDKRTVRHVGKPSPLRVQCRLGSELTNKFRIGQPISRRLQRAWSRRNGAMRCAYCALRSRARRGRSLSGRSGLCTTTHAGLAFSPDPAQP